MAPDNHNQPDRPVDKLAGALKKSALALAVVEFFVYWLLVFNFPAVMVSLSVLLGALAWYFRRLARDGALGEALELSRHDLEIVDKYCKTWIFIAAYGAAFAIFLLWRG